MCGATWILRPYLIKKTRGYGYLSGAKLERIHMSTSYLYHAQGIRGYKCQKTERTAETEIYYTISKASHCPCPKCDSIETSVVKTGKTRDILGLFVGLKKTILRVATRRIICQDCGASIQEPICFCSDSYVRHTKWAARFAIVLRADMSIRAVAQYTGMNWETVKEIEEDWLMKKWLFSEVRFFRGFLRQCLT